MSTALAQRSNDARPDRRRHCPTTLREGDRRVGYSVARRYRSYRSPPSVETGASQLLQNRDDRDDALTERNSRRSSDWVGRRHPSDGQCESGPRAVVLSRVARPPPGAFAVSRHTPSPSTRDSRSSISAPVRSAWFSIKSSMPTSCARRHALARAAAVRARPIITRHEGTRSDDPNVLHVSGDAHRWCHSNGGSVRY